MTAAVPQRVVAVRATQQGSGFLLTPRLVLTAAHTLGWSSSGEVAAVGGRGWKNFNVVGRDDELDVALLYTADSLVTPATARAFAPVRWGRIDSLEPVPDCHVTGFPQVGREGADLDAFQAVGTLAPGSASGRQRHLLALQQRPLVSPNAKSPWAGLSGGALFRGDHLLGVVISDHHRAAWGSSQLAVVPVGEILVSQRLAAALNTFLGSVPTAEAITATELADAAFERDYADAIRADYGRIRIFGLRQQAQSRRGWELDTAYLSLEAGRTDAKPYESSGRVEHLLAGRRRVLLRGQAGSGKTTLVQWLAVHAVSGEMGAELAELNHRVPLVLQLRKLFRRGVMQPRPEQFLELDDRMCADRQPEGWAHRVLSSGRALLLVDGLDEVPAAQRDQAMEWLERLLGHYPQLWTLATVRPSAVAEGWLQHLDFTELSLRPMNGQDRRLFVERWHQAALAELLAAEHTPEEAERWRRDIDQIQAGLFRALERSPELNQLADSPLLCAMLCALNRESDGVLPQRRMEIYQDAMTMMLVKRDEVRQVDGAEQLRLSKEEQLAVLSRLANWMVRNGHVECSREDAVHRIGKALRDLPDVASQGSAEQVYLHLLNRTGLIAEVSTDTFQFIHRTFQDYLAALEFKEERDFGVLTRAAMDEQWADVIRLTVGHCGRADRSRLLRMVMQRAWEAQAVEEQVLLWQLVGSCLPYAPEISVDTLEAVLAGVERAWDSCEPFRRDIERFALVGERLLPILRRRLRSEDSTELLRVAALIGGQQALSLFEEAAALPGAIVDFMTQWWKYFDAGEYAQRVLRGLDLSDANARIGRAAQLDELKDLVPIGHPVLVGDQVVEVDRWGPLAAGTRSLSLVDVTRPLDLSCLASWPRLRYLAVHNCPGVTDLAVLAGSGITMMSLVGAAGVSGLAELPGLRDLYVTGEDIESWRDGELSCHVTHLGILELSPRQRLERATVLFPNLRTISLQRPVEDCREIDLTGLADHRNLSIAIGDAENLTLLGTELFAPGQLRFL